MSSSRLGARHQALSLNSKEGHPHLTILCGACLISTLVSLGTFSVVWGVYIFYTTNFIHPLLDSTIGTHLLCSSVLLISSGVVSGTLSIGLIVQIVQQQHVLPTDADEETHGLNRNKPACHCLLSLLLSAACLGMYSLTAVLGFSGIQEQLSAEVAAGFDIARKNLSYFAWREIEVRYNCCSYHAHLLYPYTYDCCVETEVSQSVQCARAHDRVLLNKVRALALIQDDNNEMRDINVSTELPSNIPSNCEFTILSTIQLAFYSIGCASCLGIIVGLVCNLGLAATIMQQLGITCAL